KHNELSKNSDKDKKKFFTNTKYSVENIMNKILSFLTNNYSTNDHIKTFLEIAEKYGIKKIKREILCACFMNDNLELAQWLIERHKVDINSSFQIAICYGYLDIA